MEYRKLISFGKSSYVVSLPKTWVIQNKLKKGDLIYFDENKEGLVLQARRNDKAAEEKEIMINVDKKDSRRIQREIISAYIQNYKTIVLHGDEIKSKALPIQKWIQNLVALEILEQDSKRIVAKDFLNIDDISLNQIIRKMDVITRSMLKDCVNMFKEDNSENIALRDNDVNKFRFLVYRITWYATETGTSIIRKMDITHRDILNYWWIAYTIEAIADHAKRIAKFMTDITLSTSSQKDFEKLLIAAEQMFTNLMKAYYTLDHDLAHTVLQNRFELVEKCDAFYEQNKSTENIGYLMYNLKALIMSTNTIGRIVYEGIPG